MNQRRFPKPNYRNIENSFVSGGTNLTEIQELQNSSRQTRSGANAMNNFAQQPSTSSAMSNNIECQTNATTSQPWQQTAMEVNTAVVSTLETTFSERELLKLKKINIKKKISGKEKRLKQNKRLYRMLTPRNAIAALNECLLGQPIGDTFITPLPGNKFSSKLNVGNVEYSGEGTSKMGAKNSACEKALRDIVINKFRQAKQQESIHGSSEDVSMDENELVEVPMLQLASFALHKLFTEWEAEGYEVPFLKPAPEAVPSQTTVDGEEKPVIPKPPKIKNDLPPNNLTMHPVMLLSIMRPCTQYNDLGSSGVTPNITHSVGTTVDGQSFIGQGRSKKEARKRVATTVLQKLFNWEGSCC